MNNNGTFYFLKNKAEVYSMVLAQQISAHFGSTCTRAALTKLQKAQTSADPMVSVTFTHKELRALLDAIGDFLQGYYWAPLEKPYTLGAGTHRTSAPPVPYPK